MGEKNRKSWVCAGAIWVELRVEKLVDEMVAIWSYMLLREPYCCLDAC